MRAAHRVLTCSISVAALGLCQACVLPRMPSTYVRPEELSHWLACATFCPCRLPGDTALELTDYWRHGVVDLILKTLPVFEPAFACASLHNDSHIVWYQNGRASTRYALTADPIDVFFDLYIDCHILSVDVFLAPGFANPDRYCILSPWNPRVCKQKQSRLFSDDLRGKYIRMLRRPFRNCCVIISVEDAGTLAVTTCV